MARMFTRPTTPKAPKAPKFPSPKPNPDAMAPMRAPVAGGRGKDVISVVTRMRETPSRKK